MEQNGFYLEFMQKNIHRYGYQAFFTKMMAAFIAALFFVLLKVAALTSIVLAFGVGILVVLWIIDGNYSAHKESYIDLRQRAIKAGGTIQKEIVPPGKLNVSTLWNPLSIVFYIPLIAMLSFLALR